MPLHLRRSKFSDDGIFGCLTDDQRDPIAYTLEHSYNRVPKIPAGTYRCVRGHHELHSGPIETFEVTGVAGHSGILFHYGNFNDDSNGCILLGDGEAPGMITKSRDAFDRFMALCDGIDTFTLVVS